MLHFAKLKSRRSLNPNARTTMKMHPLNTREYTERNKPPASQETMQSAMRSACRSPSTSRAMIVGVLNKEPRKFLFRIHTLVNQKGIHRVNAGVKLLFATQVFHSFGELRVEPFCRLET